MDEDFSLLMGKDLLRAGGVYTISIDEDFTFLMNRENSLFILGLLLTDKMSNPLLRVEVSTSNIWRVEAILYIHISSRIFHVYS